MFWSRRLAFALFGASCVAFYICVGRCLAEQRRLVRFLLRDCSKKVSCCALSNVFQAKLISFYAFRTVFRWTQTLLHLSCTFSGREVRSRAFCNVFQLKHVKFHGFWDVCQSLICAGRHIFLRGRTFVRGEGRGSGGVNSMARYPIEQKSTVALFKTFGSKFSRRRKLVVA